MPHYGSLHAYPPIGADTDIRGAKVFGRSNEKLGEISDVILDHDTGDVAYVVVDTGGWLHSRNFLVPAEKIQLLNEDIDPSNDRFQVDLDKKQVERLPVYDASHLDAQESWSDYERRYQQAWSEDPVLHRETSTHAVTPTAAEMPIPPGSKGLGVHSEPFVPRGKEFSLNASGAADVTLTPVTSSFDTRYSAASAASPVGPHHPSDARDEVASPENAPTPTTDAEQSKKHKQSKDEKMREHLAEEAENARTITGDAIYNNADVEGLRHESFTENVSTGSRDTVSPQDFANPPMAVRLGRRWTSFQDHLRANREAITSNCQACDKEKTKKAA